MNGVEGGMCEETVVAYLKEWPRISLRTVRMRVLSQVSLLLLPIREPNRRR